MMRRTSLPPIDAETAAQIEDLLRQMTIEEKAGQLTQYFYFGEERARQMSGGDADPVARAVREGKAGSLLFLTDPHEINRMQRIAVEESRLGIPLLFGFDVIYGFRTQFPVPIAMAASWDPGQVEASQAIAAREARAAGIHWTFAPMIDVTRDPRWGRIVEGPGEDPYLAARLAEAHVRGFQGDHIGEEGRIIAGPKHFAGYGAAIGGRDYDEANISEAEMWNVYLPPFEAAVNAGCGNIMSAYMDLNGIPATGNHWLFQEILRDAWGFEGFVVSDANAVRDLETHGFARDQADAAARALATGVDMEMATVAPAYDHLPAQLEAGAIDEAMLDASVRRILEAKARMSLFANPYVDADRTASVLGAPEHHAAAVTMAERSAVLLKNDRGLLPLDPDEPISIAVIGPLANAPRDMVGPWAFGFRAEESVTIAEGIRRKAGAATVTFTAGVRNAQRSFPSMFDSFAGSEPDFQPDFDDEAEWARAIDLATNSDLAVVVVGEWKNQVGENASRSSLALPGRQQALLEAVVGTGTPAVLLVMNGRPLDLRWAQEHVTAIVDIWYPGTRGGLAAANVLFGEVNPGGKLPFSWPRHAGHIPMHYGHSASHQPGKQEQRYWDEESTPLYPFGFGLSYTTFAYDGLSLDRDSIAPGDTVTVTARVTNRGSVSGDEVAQLYIHQRHGRASRPVRELKGFERITLEPHETRTVTFRLGPDELRYWNAAVRDWVHDEATFDVWVGGDCRASLGATFEVASPAVP